MAYHARCKMNNIRRGLQQYLGVRAVLAISSNTNERHSPSSYPSSRRRVLLTSRATLQCVGPLSRSACSLGLGHGGWVWCVASPPGLAPWILGQRFRLRGFFHIGFIARVLTSIATRRLNG